MRLTVASLCAGLAAVALLLTACREDKSLGAPEIFASNATKLYFGDCDPFVEDQESVDLVYDPSGACAGFIEFSPWWGGATAEWKSNDFRVQPGTYYEGCHLVFGRDMADAGQVAVFRVAFTGLAVKFVRSVEIPVGATSATADLFEQGTVSLPAESLVRISVQITDSTGHGSLNASSGVGSYVMTGADQATVCRFKIDLGLAQGLGHPNQGVNFSYLNTVFEVAETLAWDFTGGARVLDGPVLQFGPRCGVAYLTAESGGCRDTASFWAPPGTLFRDELLERVTSYGFSPWGFVSNGITVWWWDLVANGNDTLAPWKVRVLYFTQWPLIEKPVHDMTGGTDVLYDETRDLIWIICSTTSGGDSAWGYTTAGVLDTAVAIDGNVPIKTMYLGQWLYTTSADVFFRGAALVPLTGGTPVSLGPFPAELTRQFAGGAGVGYPGVAGYIHYSINVFDSLGNWIARQPVTVNADEYVFGASILTAGRRVVYQVSSSRAHYFRALQPQ